MAKAQLEIFGIAVVFLLFIFGLMVFIKLNTTKEENIAFNFMLEQLPSRLLQTMTETTTSCQKKSVGALILDTASSQTGKDSATNKCTYVESSQITCDQQTQTKSKDELKKVIEKIIKNSLNEDKINYELEIKMPAQPCTIYSSQTDAGNDIKSDGCSKATKTSAETFTLQSQKGKVDISLKVC